MSVIASTTINNDEELTLDKRTWQRLRELEPEEIEKFLPEKEEEAEEEDLLERRFKFYNDGAEEQQNVSEMDDSDISEDERITRVDRMAEEIGGQLQQQREY